MVSLVNTKTEQISRRGVKFPELSETLERSDWVHILPNKIILVREKKDIKMENNRAPWEGRCEIFVTYKTLYYIKFLKRKLNKNTPCNLG
jgi:hypothetical protein